MPVVAQSVLLLVISNVFMTFAWYAHLKELNHKPWLIAALVSWGVALLEYLFQVPANRIGYTQLSVAQLKILQEVITLSVFVPFALLYLRRADQARLPVGRALPLRRGVLHVPRRTGRNAVSRLLECRPLTYPDTDR